MASICACCLANWCHGVKIINNLVAGLENAGVDSAAFAVPAHECGDYLNVVFKNNTAHSVDGYGAIIFRNASSPYSDNCMEASYFTAYKCNQGGIVSYDKTLKIIFSNMILIDNYYGANLMIG